MTGRARETYRKLQRIRDETTNERFLVHGIGASLAQIERKWSEAESEYRLAAELLASSGKGRSADFASVLAGLATVYLNEGQASHALLVLDQALIMLESATDAVLLNRIKLLNLKGVILGRQHRWLEAERYLSEAFTLARRQSQTDPPSNFTAWLRTTRLFSTKFIGSVRRKRFRRGLQRLEAAPR